MVTVLCLLITFFVSNICAATPESEQKDMGKNIQGVWKLESMDVGINEHKRTRKDAKFMMYIMEKHYSAIRDFTPEPETDAAGTPASGRSFMADAGTYELEGTDMIVHHKLAMFPVLGSMTFKFSMAGNDILILEPQYDKMVMPGMENIKPTTDGKMGYGDMATRYVFIRLE